MKIVKKLAIGVFILIAISVISLIIIGSMYYGSPYTGNPSDLFNSTIIVRNLSYVEQLQAESNWYQEQGENTYSGYLNVFLGVECFLGALASIFAGASIWGKRTGAKATACFIIAILVAAASAGGLYVKAENERFYEENQHQYTKLSHEINTKIREFYIEFDRRGYDDKTIDERKLEFLDLAEKLFNDIDVIKTEYFDNYGLEINPILENDK